MSSSTSGNAMGQHLQNCREESSVDLKQEEINQLRQTNQLLMAILLVIATVGIVGLIANAPFGTLALALLAMTSSLAIFVQTRFPRHKRDALTSAVLPLQALPDALHPPPSLSKPKSSGTSENHDCIFARIRKKHLQQVVELPARIHLRDKTSTQEKRTKRKERRRRRSVREENPEFKCSKSPAEEVTGSDDSSDDGITLPKGFLNCTPLPNHPTLFPYHADSNNNKEDRVLSWA